MGKVHIFSVGFRTADGLKRYGQCLFSKHNGNRYIKSKTMDHLVSMLFCVFGKCISLREVIGGMIGLKLAFQMNNLPYRSTYLMHKRR